MHDARDRRIRLPITSAACAARIRKAAIVLAFPALDQTYRETAAYAGAMQDSATNAATSAVQAVSYANWGANLAVVGCTMAAVLLAVLLHYEGLNWVSRRISSVAYAKRRVVLYAVLALIGLHIAEIWLFGLGYHLLLLYPEAGRITGSISTNIFDHVYFSATVFTTVGFGDLSPQGPIRFMAGTEALTGFVLIGWSASFTYLEMEQIWRTRRTR